MGKTHKIAPVEQGVHAQSKIARGLRVAFCLFLAACLAPFAGCVHSDTITEVIYDGDESAEIDYSIDPIYINSPTAQIKSNQLPSLTPLDAGDNERLDAMPEFEGDLSGAQVKDAELSSDDPGDEQSGDNNSEWSADDGGSQQDDVENTPLTNYDDRANAGQASGSDAGAQGQQAKANPAGSGNESDAGGAGSDADPDNAGDGAQAGGDEGEPSDESGGKNDGEGGGNNNPEGDSNVGREPGRVFNDLGSNDQLPEGVRTVAAVGNAAIVACALGGADGEQNLVATDADTLSSRPAQLLASRGISSAAECWSGDGKAAGSLNLEALLAAKPDAVLVDDNNTLSADDIATLNQAGTNVVYVPAMDSMGDIEACVGRIGILLGKGGDSAAQSLASQYVSYCQGQLANTDTSVYTLYISEWNDNPGYIGQATCVITGIALAPVGSTANPVGECLEAAGVANVPSEKVGYSSKAGTAVVWPFKDGGTIDSDWNGLSRVNAGVTIGGSGFDRALTAYSKDMTNYDLLGTSVYSKVIVRTNAQKQSLEGSRDMANGLYSANANKFAPGDDSPSSIIGSYDIVVNPWGMGGSWAEGSFESILEVAWASSEFGTREGDLKSTVVDFYNTYYGYGLSDAEYDSIVSGALAE